MHAASEHDVDVAIIGGGIAGLWVLHRLVASGYNAVLIESHALGAGQTIASQGIIHGGIKYALLGQITDASEAIAAMPGTFRDCIEGRGEVDLRDVRVNATHQFLWSVSGLGGRLTTFLAGRLARARATALPRDQRPAPFDDPRFRGRVYQLEEPVLDTQSLVRQLARDHLASLLLGVVDRPERTDKDAHRWSLRVQDPTGENNRSLTVHARHVVLTAGAGNADLAAQMGLLQPRMEMQRRPLHMVMVRGENLAPSLFGHCLGTSALPRLTITSHVDDAGRTVWYLGGEIAERGVGRSMAEQVDAARAELHEVLPWIDQSDVAWSTFHIDRAEPRTDKRKRPDLPFAETQDHVTVAWPTKLAFAPRLAAQVLDEVATSLGPAASPTGDPPQPEGLRDWPCPPIATTPWDESDRRWIT